MSLGLMYYDGIGVPCDRARAMRRAADQGDAQAVRTLARAEQAAPRASKARAPKARAPKPRAKKELRAVPMEWAPTAACAGPARRRVLPSERHAIALFFEHRCAACRALLPVGWHLDHRIRLADGGPDDATNMARTVTRSRRRKRTRAALSALSALSAPR